MKAEQRLPRPSFRWLLLPPLGLLLWWMGRAVALGGPQQVTALGVGGLALTVSVGGAFLARRAGRGILALEVPLLLLLFSTLVLRQRGAVDLAVDPLDPAAQFRVAAVGVAGLLGFFALLRGRAPERTRLTTLPFRLYVLYAVVVLAGAALSFSPILTAYRGVELAAGLLVLAGARQTLGEQAVPRIEAVLYWFSVALLVAVWLGVFLFPDEAVEQIQNPRVPIKEQIQGVYPAVASNMVGTLGIIVTTWSLGRVRRRIGQPGLRPAVAYLLACIGIFSLLAAQYRTGYVMAAAVLVVFVLMRGRKLIAAVLALAAVSIVFWGSSISTEAEPYVLRGQTPEQARELSGRMDFWRHAIPVWEKSPLIGRGLLTGTRFEVLAPLGLDYTSGIHSTWVEALVGTGLIGTALLALAFLISTRRALRQARVDSLATPILLLVAFAVRSLTGSTFEIFGYPALVFLWLTLSMEDIRGRRLADDELVTARSPGSERPPAPAPALPTH